MQPTPTRACSLMFASLILITGCSSDDEFEDLGETIAVDLEQLFQTVEETAAAVAALDAAEPTTEEACWTSTGDCEACSGYAGTSGEGTFESSMSVIPCGETWESYGRTRTYTVEASALTGSWQARDATTLDWALQGAQQVGYVVDGPRAADLVYDASWELEELVAETLDGELGDYELSTTYLRFSEVTTRLDLSGTADTGEGTIVFEDDDNDQVICTFSRDGELVTILCD